MDDIFTFGKTGKISIGAGLRNPSKAERAAILSLSSGSSDSSEDEGPAGRRGKRRRKRKEETLASRLMHNKAVALEPSRGEEDALSPDGSRWVGLIIIRMIEGCGWSLPCAPY